MLKDENKIAIAAANDSLLAKAKELSRQLALPLVDYETMLYPFLLIVTCDRLELHERRIKNSKPIFVDFLSQSLNYRTKNGGGTKQLIAKAMGIKGRFRPVVLDATAGFGVDAFVLVSLGCRVVMLERSPVIGSLLRDGLRRFINNPNANGRDLKMTLYISQAIDYINEINRIGAEKPDVIYLDPMYPGRKKSALGKKTMRVLSSLVGKDDDAEEVLELAIKCARKRVVVKRPTYSLPLGITHMPDLGFCLGGSCRYDVYFSDIIQ